MILCLSHSRDFYTIDIVRKRLEELGYASCRFNSDTFSHQLRFRYAHTPGDPYRYCLQTEEGPIPAADIAAVWYRKLWSAQPPADLDPAYRSIFLQEYDTMRDIFFDALRGVPWMNPIRQDHWVAGNKAMQLEVAAQCGLDTMPTLFSNDPAAVEAFFHEACGKQMVAKLHGTLARSMSGNVPSFPTTLIREENLMQLESLPYCPMIFQQFVPKAYELRIACIDGICYAGKIDASGSSRGNVDWRMASDMAAPWETYTLPDQLIRSIDLMMKQHGLLFGAIDMIRHQDGRYIFLEVNPQGEWGMLQRDLGYPIGQTIAEQLIARL